MTLIDDALGATAAFIPEPGAASFLTDASFILAPELDLGLGVLARDLVQRRGEPPFLKRSCAALSAFGWRGRVFCHERPSALISRLMPPSR